jgi:PAS domain S-box-containing protein
MGDYDLKIYQEIFNIIPIGLGIAAMNGKLLIFNQEILRPGAYEPKDIEALNSVVELYFDPADREKVLGLARKDGQVTNYRVRFKRKNGEPYWTLMSLRPVQFQGQPGWLASVLDIDEQVKNEEKLKINMDELDRLNKLMIGREVKMAELKEKLHEAENHNQPAGSQPANGAV